jgi:endonuclease IV
MEVQSADCRNPFPLLVFLSKAAIQTETERPYGQTAEFRKRERVLQVFKIQSTAEPCLLLCHTYAITMYV